MLHVTGFHDIKHHDAKLFFTTFYSYGRLLSKRHWLTVADGYEICSLLQKYI